MCFIILKAESVYLTLETPHSITGVPAFNFSMKDKVNDGIYERNRCYGLFFYKKILREAFTFPFDLVTR